MPKNADGLQAWLERVARRVDSCPDNASLLEGLTWWQGADAKARARCPSAGLFTWLETASAMTNSPDDDEPVALVEGEPVASGPAPANVTEAPVITEAKRILSGIGDGKES